MTTLHIEYNDKLIVGCLMANIEGRQFIREFIVNKDDLSYEERNAIIKDFERVHLMMMNDEI